MTVVGAALLLASLIPPQPIDHQAQYCRVMRTTGYVRTEFSSRTFDGTSIYTDERIVAASWDIPIDSTVWVEGYGTYRVADRGHLGSSGWIDIATWTRAEAFQVPYSSMVCVQTP